MKIISYNVNGIRAAEGKGFLDWLKTENPDIVCLQETKVQPGQINRGLYEHLGYNNYWHSAEKKGYSGVAIFTKNEPGHIQTGMSIHKYDMEGRFIRADYGDVSVISLYIPSGTTGDLRQDFKMKFLEDLLTYLKELRKERKKLILSGDFNICHKPIDINHPEKHNKASGFLPEEREWMNRFIESGFIDTFREFNTQAEQYSWWSFRANSRQKNLGWRIDYNMVTENLKPLLRKGEILFKITHSDHCPVLLEVDI